MKNLKKFFAFSIATAMVAGAVCAGTPSFQALAGEFKYWWDKPDGQYVQAETPPRDTYVEVIKEGDNYIEVHHDDEKPTVESIVIHGEDYGYPDYSYQFSAEVRYSGDKAKDNDVKWECKDENIATVDQNGMVTAKNPGTTIIIARSNWDDSKYKSFPFEVREPEEYAEYAKLRFKDVNPEKGLTIKVGDTIEIELVAEDAAKYPPKEYKYDWEVWSDSDKSQEKIATVTDGKIIGKAEGKGFVMLRIMPLSENSKPLAIASFPLEVVSADTKETTTEVAPVDPTAPTSEAQAKQEQTPESISNYQNWLATYGGGTTAAAGTTAVSGEVGQPGSEVIVDTGAGEPVTMFQSNDATNTLLAAPVGVVPSGTKIETVEAGKDTPAFKAVQNKLSRISRRGTVQKVYGIAGLNSDGSLLTTINGKAAMSMPLPSDVSVPAGKSLKVYLIDDNGQTTKLDTAIDQGRVVFEIPKFGTFAFVVE